MAPRLWVLVSQRHRIPTYVQRYGGAGSNQSKERVLTSCKGSHLCGRIEHGILDGEQVGANARRVEEILKLMPIEHIELEPGDGVFFHCNTLHRSDQNRSDRRRWTVIHCYNLAANNPFL